jgi:hypothetical protein
MLRCYCQPEKERWGSKGARIRAAASSSPSLTRGCGLPGRFLSPGKEGELGLYEKLLEERACEEANGGKSDPAWDKSQRIASYIRRWSWEKYTGAGYYGGYVSEQDLAEERDRYRSRYMKDLARLSGLMAHGVRSLGSAYVFHYLKRKYPREYHRIKAEQQGQGELL